MAFAAPVQVVGGGALGTMVAARLVQAGVEALLVVREKAGSRPVTLVTATGASEEVVVPVTATPHHRRGRFVLCTKAFDAAAAVAAHCDREARVLLLCNGVLALGALDVETIAATTTHGCFKDAAPGRVVHAGVGRVWIDGRGHDFVDDFRRAGLRPVALDEQEMTDRLWRKLAANAVLNPLTAIFQCANGDALPQAQDDARAVCREIAHLRAILAPGDNESVEEGVEEAVVEEGVEEGVEEAASALYDDVVDCANENARNFSSMYQDVQRGRRTEIDFLNGWIATTGRRVGLPTPANDRLIARVAVAASQAKNER